MLGCPTSSINRRPPFWSQIAKWKWGNDHTGWPFTSLWDSWRHNMGDYPLGRISLPEFRPWRRKKERKECRCWHSSLPFNTMMAFQRCQTEKCVGAAVCFSLLDTDSLCLAGGRDLTRRVNAVSLRLPLCRNWLDQFSFWNPEEDSWCLTSTKTTERVSGGEGEGGGGGPELVSQYSVLGPASSCSSYIT